jgi:hypothetical protein
MDLDDIPKSKTKDFTAGVSEHVYDTEAELDAFIEGVNLPQDLDVEVGTPFERKKKFVVRVKVGNFGDDD